MMKALFRQEGATLDISILTSSDGINFINEHAATLNKGFERVPMSDTMRRHLESSSWIFSGIKTFHELNEAFPSLIDENGDRKPFERFLNDVQKIDKTYNRDYLRAEYNYVQASAEMAAKWEEYSADGNSYYLQYRTAGDERVRPAHAMLNGITLPQSDSFWDKYYPPNGWNCRCTVVQVRKDKHPETPHGEAMSRARGATSDDKKGIFQFNSGKQQKAVPDYNAYTIRRCRDCIIPKESKDMNLASKGLKPLNTDLCKACQLIRIVNAGSAKKIRKLAKPLQGTTITNKEFKREVVISGRTIKEWTNQPHKHYREKNMALLNINEIFKNAEYCGLSTYKDRQSYLFIAEIAGEDNVLIVHKYDTGEYILHSVSDSGKLLEIARGLKQKR